MWKYCLKGRELLLLLGAGFTDSLFCRESGNRFPGKALTIGRPGQDATMTTIYELSGTTVTTTTVTMSAPTSEMTTTPIIYKGKHKHICQLVLLRHH